MLHTKVAPEKVHFISKMPQQRVGWFVDSVETANILLDETNNTVEVKGKETVIRLIFDNTVKIVISNKKSLFKSNFTKQGHTRDI